MNKKKLNNNQNHLNNKYQFLMTNPENLTKKYYEKILAYDLILKKNYTTIMQLPHLEKIVLNTTSKIYINDKKLILFTLAALELISGQKPQLTYARKSIANFKIRQHQILGCKVTLRKNQMYIFLDKLSKIIFPRIRDYSHNQSIIHINPNTLFSKKSTKFITQSFGFQNMMIFPELENNFELVDNFKGMNLTFVLSNSNTKNFNIRNSNLLLSGFQLPF